jgi:ketosteroid isomerase-like protein
MTHHEHPNVTLVREGFAAFERGDMARMDQLLSDDVVWHVGGNSKWAGSCAGKATEVYGMAENDAAVDPFLDALPD